MWHQIKCNIDLAADLSRHDISTLELAVSQIACAQTFAYSVVFLRRKENKNKRNLRTGYLTMAKKACNTMHAKTVPTFFTAWNISTFSSSKPSFNQGKPGLICKYDCFKH